jgi:hypothetical protein
VVYLSRPNAQLCTVAKIGDLDRPVQAQQNVVRLDVSVDDGVGSRVQVLQALQDHLAHGRDLRLVHRLAHLASTKKPR